MCQIVGNKERGTVGLYPIGHEGRDDRLLPIIFNVYRVKIIDSFCKTGEQTGIGDTMAIFSILVGVDNSGRTTFFMFREWYGCE